MTIKSKNIFNILDSDDEDVPQQVSKKVVVKEASTAKAAGGSDSRKQRADGRGGRGASRGGRGASRGGRGGRGGKRDFDRKSGSGYGRETSKHGGGAHNWGNEKDATELAAEAEILDDSTADENTPANATDSTPEPVEEEEEPITYTLDEYLEMKKGDRKGENFEELNVRQITDDFSEASLVSKQGKTPDFIASNMEKIYRERSKGRKKQLFEGVGFRAPDKYEQRGGRGDRGSDRGRGGRGRGSGRGGFRGGRGGRGNNSKYAPNVSDMKSFPTLG